MPDNAHLFAPLRTELELQEASQTWNEAFSDYAFSPRHTSMMRNMNVLYECRDASHDFALLRRAAASLNLGYDNTECQPTLQSLRDRSGDGLPDPDNLQLL